MIMNYEGILEFKGTWRRYQARVLEHADRYMADGKIHIVAAPGSGKTTLGIELIRRMNGKALILAPSITIREQWIARIEEAFLCEGIQGEDYLSQNLKQPKAITVATYQALHSAMTRKIPCPIRSMPMLGYLNHSASSKQMNLNRISGVPVIKY